MLLVLPPVLLVTVGGGGVVLPPPLVLTTGVGVTVLPPVVLPLVVVLTAEVEEEVVEGMHCHKHSISKPKEQQYTDSSMQQQTG